jgi:deoxycytidine triphosphate deaminase
LEPLTGKEAAARVTGIIVPKYQVHAYTVDLTVRGIYSIDPVGALDFSGSEYMAAGRVALASQRRAPEDKYEWWEVGRGSYFVEFNETLELAADEIAILEPHERLLRAGAAHVPVLLRGRVAPLETLLFIDAVRLQVKQNARIAQLRVFRFSRGATQRQSSRKTARRK